MTVEQATCELMERNVKELSYLTRDINPSFNLHLYYKYNNKITLLDGEEIEYEKLKILIEDDEDRFVFEDKFSNYGPDFKSQKKFMLNILKNLHIYHGECIEMVDKKICADNDYFFDVLGEGCTYKEVSLDINYNDFIFSDDEEYKEYERQSAIKIITDKIKKNLNKNKIRVLIYSNNYNDKIYISRVTYKHDLYVHCINNKNKDFIKNIKSLNDLNRFPFVILPIVYSPTTDKELERAVEFIKKSHLIQK